MRAQSLELQLAGEELTRIHACFSEIWYNFDTAVCKSSMSTQRLSDSSRPVRRYIRRKLDMRIRILSQANGREVVHGRCITISEGGFGAILTQELPAQNEVWVQFRSPNLAETNQIRAEVRQAKGFHYGFQFVSPDKQARSFIRRLVAQGSEPA